MQNNNFQQQQYNQEDFFEEESIDLRHYWRVLMRFKWGILGLGLLSAIITALVLINADDIYESSATLMIESTSQNIASIEELYGIETQSREYFNTQFELLRNRSLAERVVRELNLLEHPDFRPEADSGFSLRGFISGLIPSGNTGNSAYRADPEQVLFNQVLNTFNNKLTITPIRNTDLVDVTFESTDPVLAANVANNLANAYIENYLEQRLASTQQATGWMTDRLSGLRATLDESESRLQAFIESENVVDIEGMAAALNVQELDELTTQNNQARRERAEAETLFRQIQQINNSASTQELLAIPAVLNHPSLERVQDNLNEVEQQIAELSQRYGRNHPRMIALNSQLNEVMANLGRQVQQVLRSIENDYRAALDNERVTQERLDTAIASYQNVNSKSFDLAALQREVETNRELYDTFFSRLRETDEADSFQASPAIIVDPAVPAINPSKPRRSLITAIALAAGLMLGIMLAFLRDMLDNTIHTPADIDERLNTNTLGLIPFAKENKNKKDSKLAYLGFIEDSHSSFSESFRTIRTGMMLSSIDQPYKMINVTSSVPNEGKTTISINLAAVMGQMKKTILIDADMRRPALAKSLDIPTNSPGLSNVMAGTAELKDCIHFYEKGNFSFMSSGQIVPNPSEVISSPKFVQLLKALTEKFDQVIIDTPPTQAVSDALIMGSIADAIVYVVKADSTPINVVKTGLSRLNHANGNVIGIALNQVDTEKQSSHYYYGGYYDSYGYSGKTAS
jgi:succinoglycan biosynthesis transport protein ExoP